MFTCVCLLCVCHGLFGKKKNYDEMIKSAIGSGLEDLYTVFVNTCMNAFCVCSVCDFSYDDISKSLIANCPVAGERLWNSYEKWLLIVWTIHYIVVLPIAIFRGERKKLLSNNNFCKKKKSVITPANIRIQPQSRVA